ncbi:MAG: hypothetical protein ABII09_03235 [Planctomycetota bacterium]
MSKQTEKYISKIHTYIPGPNYLLRNAFVDTIAGIYVAVKLSLLRPEIGQKITSALEPFIEGWREERFDDEEYKEMAEYRQKWICLCDRFIAKKIFTTQKIKDRSNITTGIRGLNSLLNHSDDETLAAIYAVLKLSLLRPEIGQKITSALRPLIGLWRKGHYDHRLARGVPEEIQRWICFCDRFITKRLYRKYK